MPLSCGGDDLNVVGIDGGQCSHLVQRRLEPGIGRAGNTCRQRIAKREGDLALAALEKIEVLDRTFGGLDRGARAFDIVGQHLGDGDAERIIDPRGAAGQDVDEVVGRSRNRNERKAKNNGAGYDAASGQATHEDLLPALPGFAIVEFSC